MLALLNLSVTSSPLVITPPFPTLLRYGERIEITMSETPGDGSWVTYRDLARRRGVRLDTARALARRNQWPKQPDNQGNVLVLVPDTELQAPPSPVVSHGESPEVTVPVREVASPDREVELHQEVSDLKSLLVTMTERAVTAEAEARVLREAWARERAQVDRLQDELREARTPWWQKMVRGWRG